MNLKMRIMKVVKKTFFRNILYLLPRHKKNCLPCINLYLVSWPSPGPGELNKMSDLFKNVFLHIIERTIDGTCTVMLHMLKYVPGVQGVHGDVLRTLYFNVQRTSVEEVVRTLAGSVPWRYIEDHMGTSIGRLFSGRNFPEWEHWNYEKCRCECKQ